MPDILVSKHGGKLGEGFSSRDRAFSGSDPGRPWNRPAGGWVDDLVGLLKFIMLCPFCVNKFNPKKHHYELWRQSMYVVGKCDGCNQVSTHARGFIHQSTHDNVGEWERPHKGGRWSGPRK